MVSACYGQLSCITAYVSVLWLHVGFNCRVYCRVLLRMNVYGVCILRMFLMVSAYYVCFCMFLSDVCMLTVVQTKCVLYGPDLCWFFVRFVLQWVDLVHVRFVLCYRIYAVTQHKSCNTTQIVHGPFVLY